MYESGWWGQEQPQHIQAGSQSMPLEDLQDPDMAVHLPGAESRPLPGGWRPRGVETPADTGWHLFFTFSTMSTCYLFN